MECMEKGALGMTRRQVVALGAATAAALALGGCAPQSPSPATGGGKSALSFTPGVYAGAAEGRGGLVTVEVAFGENAIEAVTVIDHAETSFISDMALKSCRRASWSTSPRDSMPLRARRSHPWPSRPPWRMPPVRLTAM